MLDGEKMRQNEQGIPYLFQGMENGKEPVPFSREHNIGFTSYPIVSLTGTMDT
jgi:hypothetical protein